MLRKNAKHVGDLLVYYLYKNYNAVTKGNIQRESVISEVMTNA